MTPRQLKQFGKMLDSFAHLIGDMEREYSIGRFDLGDAICKDAVQFRTTLATWVAKELDDAKRRARRQAGVRPKEKP